MKTHTYDLIQVDNRDTAMKPICSSFMRSDHNTCGCLRARARARARARMRVHAFNFDIL